MSMKPVKSLRSMKTPSRAHFRVARLLRACSGLPAGVVSLVGAGPGDPGLLTLKAARRLAEADVVFHDALVSDEILELCRPGIRLVSVGKRRGSVTLPQDEIVKALVREARAGRSVVRLKGGDPFVFGRGGEEALALLASGTAFEIVPGVSAGVAVPALAGIPLTHRGMSSSVAFVTAHHVTESCAQRLAHLAHGSDTLVVFMAGAQLHEVRGSLAAAGMPADTPAALVESGSLPRQRVARGTLATLPDLLAPRASGPVLLILGRTVGLSDELRAAASLPTRIDIDDAHPRARKRVVG